MNGSIVVSMSAEDIQAIAATVVKQLRGVRFTIRGEVGKPLIVEYDVTACANRRATSMLL